MPAAAIHPIESAPRPELAQLFEEESALWERELLWSFDSTRRRLESALDEGSLRGLAAFDEAGACAYATYATDGRNGIMGGLFTSLRARALGIEATLAGRILDGFLRDGRSIIDGQTLFSSEPGLIEPFASRGFVSASRLYMSVKRKTWFESRKRNPVGFRSKPARRGDLKALTRLVYEAHLKTRDLDASSSFDSWEACERILRQILIEEVCGPCDATGSRAVEANGKILAASLLTWPAPEVAHVSEVATTPSHQRQGLARRCLTESLDHAFDRGGATAATLSVTAANHAAIALYGSMGFVPRVHYHSHVFRTPLQ